MCFLRKRKISTLIVQPNIRICTQLASYSVPFVQYYCIGLSCCTCIDYVPYLSYLHDMLECIICIRTHNYLYVAMYIMSSMHSHRQFKGNAQVLLKNFISTHQHCKNKYFTHLKCKIAQILWFLSGAPPWSSHFLALQLQTPILHLHFLCTYVHK